jgi:hypothetical protein
MKKIFKQLTLITLVGASTLSVSARENVGGNKASGKLISSNNKVLAGCLLTTAKSDLDINNIRTTILAGGDMWWDLTNAKYEVPKNSGNHSVYAGSIWLGGYDANGNLKVAAQTYRQAQPNTILGNDFWAGPISSNGGVVDISSTRCNEFDRHWKVSKADVAIFKAGGGATTDISEWPGNGNVANGELKDLAPYVDVAGDGTFNSGVDYPRYYDGVSDIDTTTCPGTSIGKCDNFVFGDQTLWWVFNDVGGIKNETGSQPIGIEIRAQAFAFATNDAINDMTFYKYQVINRSNVAFDSTYFGQWVDPDLGDAVDDYVGCDVGLGLGFIYNGDADDGGGVAGTYGFNPPALGIDFFQGPIADANDGVDNDKDGITDECGEPIIMSNFLYYDNLNNVPTGNPADLDDYYQYMSGSWADGNRWTRGGTGYDPLSVDYVNYIFPGTTDPDFLGIDWSEVSENNVVGDRRFLQAAGSFTLLPGAVNYITTGLVWARTTSGGPEASVELVKIADEKAQALFDNCFKPLDGPNAPKVAIREYSNKLILSLEETENNLIEQYNEKDFDATFDTLINVAGQSIFIPEASKFYKFQGFKIYQVLNDEVRSTDINNADKARLLYRVDIKDNIDVITNYSFNAAISSYIAIPGTNAGETGANSGIRHTFEIERDVFTGDKLVNHKAYYFLAISYAYNNYYPFEYFPVGSPIPNNTQQQPYLEGRLGFDGGENKPFSGIPHAIAVENGGTVLNSEYGTGVVVKRIEGQGNGGQYLNMTSSSLAQAVNPPYIVTNPTYEQGNGPLNIRVYDPLRVEHAHMEVKFDGVADNSLWYAFEEETQSFDTSLYGLSQPAEQIINTETATGSKFDWGLTASIGQVGEPGNADAVNNGFLGSSISFSNGVSWLTGVKDTDGGLGTDRTDWIVSGDVTDAIDPDEAFEGVVGGTWAPYKLTYKATAAGADSFSVKWSGVNEATYSLSPSSTLKTGVNSVDIIITPDKNKWTRCPVVETGNPLIILTDTLAGDTTGIGLYGGAKRFDKREALSVDKNGRPYGSAGANNTEAGLTDPIGMGWFPGYAVNIETGERLNMAFGENSALKNQNGADMIWNPTSTLKQDQISVNGNNIEDYLVAGGMHYVYVFGHNDNRPTKDIPRYDEGARLNALMKAGAGSIIPNVSANATSKRDVWKDAMWVSQAIMAPGKSFSGNVPESEVTIKIRVAKKYRTFATTTADTVFTGESASIQEGTTYYVIGSAAATYAGTSYAVGTSFVGVAGTDSITGALAAVLATINGANPLYEVTNDGLEPTLNQTSVAQSALDLINVVPNPYYAYSSYEKQTNEAWVKITNLPAKCVVSVYTLNGTLIRRFNREVATDNSAGTQVGLSSGTESGSGNTDTSLDWDLKNQKNVPIGSGVYLIHVQAEGLGEKTLRWFGMMRPIDLDSY